MTKSKKVLVQNKSKPVTMTLMRGLPASGKTEKAKELVRVGNTVRINKDLLRTMLHFDKWDSKNEKFTHEASTALARHFLVNGTNVIIDDTNLNPETVKRWRETAHSLRAKDVNVTVRIEDLGHVDIATCIDRDNKRQNGVGAHVIAKMALRYMEAFKGARTVICDVDGTIADIKHRLHHLQGEKKNWKAFFDDMHKDKVRDDVLNEVMHFLDKEKAHLIFVSARPEGWREDTEQWLTHALAGTGYENDYLLLMREDGDARLDTVIKSEIWARYLKHLDIVKVFDDRPSVIRMWEELGLSVVDVGDGIEF